uniref:Uncharacterized protein n=1 Tax=Vespula pensylvanica TaxID=30213 RepID=A0A834P010_VESPE|nr:hypothetical protein H0235_008579 [Vespula pensylvanica]
METELVHRHRALSVGQFNEPVFVLILFLLCQSVVYNICTPKALITKCKLVIHVYYRISVKENLFDFDERYLERCIIGSERK